jgi:hypothetical protein
MATTTFSVTTRGNLWRNLGYWQLNEVYGTEDGFTRYLWTVETFVPDALETELNDDDDVISYEVLPSELPPVTLHPRTVVPCRECSAPLTDDDQRYCENCQEQLANEDACADWQLTRGSDWEDTSAARYASGREVEDTVGYDDMMGVK